MKTKAIPILYVDPPAHLSEPSKQLWKHLLETGRIRTLPRLALLQTALEARDRADEARLKIGDALTIKTERSGVEHLNPLLRLERENRQLFVKIMGQLSLHGEICQNPFD